MVLDERDGHDEGNQTPAVLVDHFHQLVALVPVKLLLEEARQALQHVGVALTCAGTASASMRRAPYESSWPR